MENSFHAINSSLLINEKNIKLEKQTKPELVIVKKEISEGSHTIEHGRIKNEISDNRSVCMNHDPIYENGEHLSIYNYSNIKTEKELHQEIIIKEEVLDEEIVLRDTKVKPFLCNFCVKSFSYQNDLIRHERIHTGEKPFACEVCDKTFNQQCSLIKHKRIHTGEKPFTCDVCHKTFTNKSNLVVHRRIHSGEKPFACDICNKTFNERSSLIKHETIHTGEKPFSCDICDKSFKQHSHLVKHKRTQSHLETKSAKPFGST